MVREEIQPKGFKYIVTVMINENLEQGGTGSMACHWEDTDTATQEMYIDVSLGFPLPSPRV